MRGWPTNTCQSCRAWQQQLLIVWWRHRLFYWVLKLIIDVDDKNCKKIKGNTQTTVENYLTDRRSIPRPVTEPTPSSSVPTAYPCGKVLMRANRAVLHHSDCQGIGDVSRVYMPSAILKNSINNLASPVLTFNQYNKRLLNNCNFSTWLTPLLV